MLLTRIAAGKMATRLIMSFIVASIMSSLALQVGCSLWSDPFTPLEKHLQKIPAESDFGTFIDYIREYMKSHEFRHSDESFQKFVELIAQLGVKDICDPERVALLRRIFEHGLKYNINVLINPKKHRLSRLLVDQLIEMKNVCLVEYGYLLKAANEKLNEEFKDIENIEIKTFNKLYVLYNGSKLDVRNFDCAIQRAKLMFQYPNKIPFNKEEIKAMLETQSKEPVNYDNTESVSKYFDQSKSSCERLLNHKESLEILKPIADLGSLIKIKDDLIGSSADVYPLKWASNYIICDLWLKVDKVKALKRVQKSSSNWMDKLMKSSTRRHD